MSTTGGDIGTSFANGGGGTDLRTTAGNADGGFAGADSRQVVAGAGGGGDCFTGGAGGGLVGQAGHGYNGAQYNPQGGGQTSGGAGSLYYEGCPAGALWQGGGNSSKGAGGGGGGGYYGGGSEDLGSSAGGSSHVVPAGTILFNSQGDARCAGNGVLYVTPMGLYAPSPVPTTLPGAAAHCVSYP